MIPIQLLLSAAGIYFIVSTFIESRLPDGLIIEKQVYILLYTLGAILLVYGILLPKIITQFRTIFFVRIVTVMICAAIVFLFITACLIIAAPLFLPRADGSESVALVLGAPVVNNQPSCVLRSRADKAAEWLAKHPDIPVLISGGKGGTESEAKTISNLITDKGTEPNRIALEEKSAATEENFRYAKEILNKDHDIAINPVAVLTSEFHVFRLRYIIKRVGYSNVRFITASTPASVGLLWYAREVILVIRYWLTGIL